MVLTFLELLFEVVCIRLDRRPELFQCGAQGALDSAVELRRARFVGPKLDGPVEKSFLNLTGQELAATIGLNPLDRNGASPQPFYRGRQGIRLG
jgi:hypothetical protein